MKKWTFIWFLTIWKHVISFGDSIYNSKINISETEMDQSNLSGDIIFNELQVTS